MFDQVWSSWNNIARKWNKFSKLVNYYKKLFIRPLVECILRSKTVHVQVGRWSKKDKDYVYVVVDCLLVEVNRWINARENAVLVAYPSKWQFRFHGKKEKSWETTSDLQIRQIASYEMLPTVLEKNWTPHTVTLLDWSIKKLGHSNFAFQHW